MSIENFISCDAMGGQEGCCGYLEWKADGRVICNECGIEYVVKPIKSFRLIENIIIIIGIPFVVFGGILRALKDLSSRENKCR